MPNNAGFADHLQTTVSIPRKVKPEHGAAMIGFKHGPDLMAMYGPDGRLVSVFDSAREADLIVREGSRPVTAADLRSAQFVPFDDDAETGTTYFIGGETGAIKIGRSVNADVRLRDIQACCPIPIRLLATRKGASREKMYHRLFAADRLHGEWFARSPAILAEIARLNQNGPQQCWKHCAALTTVA